MHAPAPAPGAVVVVGSCQGFQVIDAQHEAEFYQPFRVASAVGAVLFALLVWLLEG